MHCSCEVLIDKPIQQVWDYTNNPDNLKLWLNDFIRYEHLSGDMQDPKVGDTSKHTYDQNGKEFTMKEEIVAYSPPNHIKLFLTHKSFVMDMVNDLEEVGPNQTKLIASAQTVRAGMFTKLMMKIFMPPKKMQKDHEAQINKLKSLIEAE